jgi:hypothetical protein
MILKLYFCKKKIIIPQKQLNIKLLGLADCKKNLHGKLMLNKDDKLLTARDLKIKLTARWKISNPLHEGC